MSDEIIVNSITVTETIELRPASAPVGIYEHYCMHADCKRWGSLGFESRHGTLWFCGQHRADGEKLR